MRSSGQGTRSRAFPDPDHEMPRSAYLERRAAGHALYGVAQRVRQPVQDKKLTGQVAAAVDATGVRVPGAMASVFV